MCLTRRMQCPYLPTRPAIRAINIGLGAKEIHMSPQASATLQAINDLRPPSLLTIGLARRPGSNAIENKELKRIG